MPKLNSWQSGRDPGIVVGRSSRDGEALGRDDAFASVSLSSLLGFSHLANLASRRALALRGAKVHRDVNIQSPIKYVRRLIQLSLL